MLPVSLGCLRPVSYVPNVASVSVVFALCRMYLMLPVSLGCCLRPVSYVPNVASVSGLSSPCVVCT